MAAVLQGPGGEERCMAVKGEPSYADLVYDVVQSADQP